MEICTPSFVYFVLGVLSIFVLIVKEASSLTLLVKIISTGIWTWLLNFMCNNNYTIGAWVLVAFPFIIDVILILARVIVIVDTVQKYQYEVDEGFREGARGRWFKPI